MIEPIEFRNRRGERLDTSFHPGSREGRLVILGHGVTANKDRPLLVAVAEGLAAVGWSCLRLSFSGNGESEGEFGEATVTKESEDLRDVIAALPQDLKLAYCGHSMGGAVGLVTAPAEPRIRVLVTLAGMVRTEAFCGREFGGVTPGEGFMWDEPDCPLSPGYVEDMQVIGDLFDEIRHLRVPYLLVHGTADDVVLPEDSEDAFETATEPKRLVRVEGKGHMFDEASYAEVTDAVADWLGKFMD